MTKLLLLAFLALPACTILQPKQPPPVEYKTAVAVSCVEKPAPVRPQYETETLSETATDGQVAIALARDWGRSRIYEGKLETIVAGCQ